MPPAAPLADADPAENRPVEGPGSFARLAPRAVALLIDWALCSVIAMGLLGYRWGGSGAEGFKPLAVFAVENLLLVSTLGMTLGHRVMGMQVQRVSDGAAPGLLAGAVRTVLLCLAIPAVVTDSSGRGLHDKLAGTVIVRTR
ncbi:RDD family protein [Dermacoccus nishinomiyaensis]|uniref:RDD family protein n=1 Tax=Dermacoccus TaxID=57495 RepID=UPI0007861B47|nr:MULTISPECIES: RDD family protein [Dermacoccus]MBO1758044.1 RDD family protein [Dermacoccus sp. NHGro5]QQY25854.1 RDD family protein [Dermacoccus nishinomiyaensis]STD16134.1 RDD family [Dermacoccus nishinomiyaensis]